MKSRKSSILNLNPSIISAFLWVLLFTTFTYTSTLPLIIILFLILKFENRSELVRNHAGQALITAIVAFLLAFTLNMVITLVLAILSWIPILNITSQALAHTIKLILQLIVLAYCALGFIKALQEKFISVPILAVFGTRLSDSIKP